MTATDPTTAPTRAWGSDHGLAARIVLACSALLAAVVLIQVPFAYVATPALEAAARSGAEPGADAATYLMVRGLPILGAMLLAFLTTVTWLWQARGTSEALMPNYRHNLSRPWLVASWVIPVVSLWFPLRGVRDIWVASALRNRGDRPPFRLWWWAWVGFYALDNLAAVLVWAAERVPGWLGWLGHLHLLSALCLLASLVGWVRVVRAVVAAQREPSEPA